MKKRFFALIFLFLTALVLYFVKGLIPTIYLNIGKNAYLKKDYTSAYKSLKRVVSINPKDKEARYYLVQSMIRLVPTYDVQKELFELSQKNYADTADLLADRQIEIWRQKISLNAGENYIEQVPFHDEILRWDSVKFPIKVNFDADFKGSIPDYYTSQIKKAFSQWQASTNNFIKFEYTDNIKDAQIVVNFASSSEMNKCDQQECKYTVAYTTPLIKGEVLQKMDIKFYDKHYFGEPYTPKEVYNTALHEIGHALGIMGHSYNKSDLMYMESSNPDEAYDALRSDFQAISAIDLNTLMLLYRLAPDISNTRASKIDTRKLFYAPIVLGSEKQINSRKLQEAQNYIKQAPNLPNGYIDLASVYVEEESYNKAIQSLNLAYERSSNDSEKFVIYYNYAVIYMKLEDWDDTLKYANLAKSIQPSEEIDGLIAYVYYNKGDKELAKKTLIENLGKNPSNTIDAVNLARIYLKEFNFVQTGKVLNKLIKANPDAMNDPSVRMYSWIMIIFK